MRKGDHNGFKSPADGIFELLEKVIGFEYIVEISGADFDEDTNFWKLVSAKAGLAYEDQFASEKQIPSTSDKYTKKETFSLTKDKIIEYYKENDLVLVIDDFHYAPEGKRMQIAQQLGVVIGGFQNFLADLQTSLPGHFQHGADVQTDILHQLRRRKAFYGNLRRNGIRNGNVQLSKPQLRNLL